MLVVATVDHLMLLRRPSPVLYQSLDQHPGALADIVSAAGVLWTFCGFSVLESGHEPRCQSTNSEINCDISDLLFRADLTSRSMAARTVSDTYNSEEEKLLR